MQHSKQSQNFKFEPGLMSHYEKLLSGWEDKLYFIISLLSGLIMVKYLDIWHADPLFLFLFLFLPQALETKADFFCGHIFLLTLSSLSVQNNAGTATLSKFHHFMECDNPKGRGKKVVQFTSWPKY